MSYNPNFQEEFKTDTPVEESPSPRPHPDEKCRPARRKEILLTRKQLENEKFYTLFLDIDKSKFFDLNYAVLEGDILAISTDEELEHDNNEIALDSIRIARGDRCFVAVRKELKFLFESVIPRAIADEREQKGLTRTTGWMRHELYGLAAAVKVPMGGGNFNVSKLERTKRGIRCLDFRGEFLGIVDLESEDTQLPVSRVELSCDNDSILTIKQADLQERLTRHRHFAKWLVKTFGLELLSRGSGVLDVAGGNGKLAAAFAKLGVPCTILDPKPRCKETGCIRILAEPLVGAGESLTAITHPYSNVIKNCSLIVGLHPDDATEALVDMALRLHKPFAVSPCCVMTKLFPNRIQQRTGEPVRTVHALCRYLLEKSPGFQPFEVDFLPFAGRNKVIFSRKPVEQNVICVEIKD